MLHRRYSQITFLALGLLGCSKPPESEQAEVCASYGFDYDRLKRRAATDPAALRGFLVVGGLMDGAAAEGYDEDLDQLRTKLGNRALLECTRRMGGQARAMATGFLGNSGATLGRSGLFPEIDWTSLAGEMNATMFERVELTWEGRTVSLLGFEPSFVTEPADRDGILELWVGSRAHGTLFVVREDGALYGAKLIHRRSESEGHGLETEDVRRALAERKDQTPFLPLSDGMFYVESRLYDDLVAKGVKIPAHCWRFPDAQIEPAGD